MEDDEHREDDTEDRLTGPRHITYTCTGCDFAITDTGDEVKRVWAKHLRDVAAGAGVGA